MRLNTVAERELREQAVRALIKVLTLEMARAIDCLEELDLAELAVEKDDAPDLTDLTGLPEAVVIETGLAQMRSTILEMQFKKLTNVLVELAAILAMFDTTDPAREVLREETDINKIAQWFQQAQGRFSLRELFELYAEPEAQKTMERLAERLGMLRQAGMDRAEASGLDASRAFQLLRMVRDIKEQKTVAEA